jgi:peptidoglycan/xylan/chitin deacetylase (PgdA/CDA1 family)
MQLPLFPKPIFKKLTTIGFLLIALIYVLSTYASVSKLYFIPLLLIWIGLLVLGTFKISAGVYLTAFCEAHTKESIIALTFDDGPNEKTVEILEILNKYQAKATFFLPGIHVKKFPEIVKNIKANKHQIGNHSYSHSNQFPLFPFEQMVAEIQVTNGIIKEITGEEPTLFRPPFGVTNPRLARAIEKTKLRTIGWSVRSLDTVTKDPEKVIKRIIAKTKPGSILLLHDYVQDSAYILEHILKHYSNLNYKFVTVDELLAAPKK